MNSDQLAEKAKAYTEYDMIQKHTELPDYPRFRTSLLFAFLNKFSSVSSHSELFTIVVSLVQMGLDTHDMVPGSYIRAKSKVNRSLQLKVLAGDYFSSRYYRLLSEGGHIGLVQQLSEAICEVNRLKMSFYISMQKLKLTSEEFLQQTVAIKSQLFTTFSTYIEDVYRKGWQELLHGFTKCEVISEEIMRNESNLSFRFSWAFWNVFQNSTKIEKKQLLEDNMDQAKLKSLLLKYNISSQLHQMLAVQLSSLQTKIKHLGSDKLAEELYLLSESFARFLPASRVLEEI